MPNANNVNSKKKNYLEVSPKDGCSECCGNWRGGMVCDTCNGNFRHEDSGISTYKGFKYDLNSMYMLSDGTHAVLDFICEDGFVVSRLGSNEKGFLVSTIELPDLSMGTITDAPLKLEDGEWYMCKDGRGAIAVLFFDGAVFTSHKGGDGDSCGMIYNNIKPIKKVFTA